MATTEYSELDKLRTREELVEYQAECRARMQELHDEYGVRPLPESERGEYDDLKGQDEDVVRRLAEYDAREADIRAKAQNPGNVERELTVYRPASARTEVDDPFDISRIRIDPSNPESATREYRDQAMRVLDVTRFPHERANHEDCQGHVARLIDNDPSGEVARRVILTGSYLYERAFIKTLFSQPLSPQEHRTLTIGTPKAGAGLAVPFQLDATVIPISNSVVNPIRSIARVETLTGTDEWRGITSTAITSQYRAEGTETTDNAPTIAQPTVRAQRADAFVPFSRELGQDWGGLLTEMAMLLQESKDDLESVQFWSGVGTTVFPEGVFAGLSTTQRVAVATNGAFVVGDLYSLNSAIPPRHRPRTSYVANLTNLNRIRAFDTTGTLYTTLGAPNPDRLLGRPIYENSAAGTALTVNVPIVLGGDFNRYLIVDRLGMEVEVIPHLTGTTANYPNGMRGLLAFWRNSAIVLDDNAFRYLASTA